MCRIAFLKKSSNTAVYLPLKNCYSETHKNWGVFFLSRFGLQNLASVVLLSSCCSEGECWISAMMASASVTFSLDLNIV